jgi:hypothetical protein
MADPRSGYCMRLNQGILALEDIPLPAGYWRGNLLLRRDFVKVLPGQERLAVAARAAPTAEGRIPTGPLWTLPKTPFRGIAFPHGGR